jgi:hypothetical protein
LQKVQLEAMKLQEVQLERSRIRAAWTPRTQRRRLPCAWPRALPSMMWTMTSPRPFAAAVFRAVPRGRRPWLCPREGSGRPPPPPPPGRRRPSGGGGRAREARAAKAWAGVPGPRRTRGGS